MSSVHSIRRFALALALTSFLALGAGPAGALQASALGSIGSGTRLPPIGPTIYVPTAPAAPLSAVLGPKTSTTMTVVWSDGSANESGYRIERQNGASWTVVASLAPVGGSVIGFGTSYKVTGLTQDTSYCLRVVPYNEVGSTPSPSLCATTTRVSGPITVVVSDLQGLQGELEDLTPLVYQPTVFANALQLATTVPPPYTIPTARKIVYVADSAVIRIPTGALFRLQQGVHLVSGRRGLVQGALLYSDATTSTTMIRVVGDNVRISGLRLRGPSAGTDENLAGTIGVLVRDVRDFVFDHNECFQWTASCVKVQHAAGLLQMVTAGRVRITENYFHHNQRLNLGYGVEVKDAAYAYIDKNTFDWNRHAIASDGGRNVIPDPSYGPEQGYLAYLNLVLPGHSYIEYGAGVVEHQTHNFDVHGTESNGLGVDYYDGWAGEFFDVADNSFLGILGTAFNIRGTPSAGAYFHGNVTPLGDGGYDGGNYSYGAASYYDGGWALVNEESDRANVYVYGNIPSADPRERLAVGDFDGDGRSDVFLATGRAWYVSYGGVTEWRFLHASDRTMLSLSLADLDGNGRTDVVTRIGTVWHVWWNGSAAFVPLATAPFLPPQAFYTNAGELLGDFNREGSLDTLAFDPDGDRTFRIRDGRTGILSTSRQQM